MERGLKIFPLTKTRRCPKSHVRHAKQHNPTSELEALPDAPEGVIETHPLAIALDLITPGSLIQCRNNAPLASLCWQLLRRGIKVQIAGKDIGDGLIALIKRLKVKSIPSLIEKLEIYRGRELAKAEKQRNAGAAAAVINDKCDCIVAFTEGLESVEELVAKITAIFADFDESGTPKESVLLSSSHKAKGLEAEYVWILDPSLYPSRYADRDWEKKQEQNLMWVRDTRSSYFMGFITVDKK